MRIVQPNDEHRSNGGEVMPLNKLLSRQLRKYFGDDLPDLDRLQAFISAVNDSYNHFERDKTSLERSREVSYDELKDSTQKLIESEGKFHEMALTVPGMLYQFVLRPDGTMMFPYVSPGSLDLVELSPETVTQDALSIISLIHEDDRESFHESVALSARSLTAWDWTGRAKLSGGQLKWLKGRSRPRKSTDGSILWNGLLVDVTDSKENEEKLQLFRNLVNQSNDAVFVTNVETSRFLYVNEKACASLGYSRSQLLTMRVPDIETIVSDDTLWHEYVQLIASKGSLLMESEHRREDGSTFPVEMSLKYISEGSKNYLIGIARDMTEHKRAQKALKDKERFYEQIINANRNLIFVKNARGQYTMVNEAFANIHQATVEQLIGKTDADFHPNKNEIAVFHEQDQRVIQSRLPTSDIESAMQDAETGHTRYFQTIKVPLVSEEGITQVLGIATDITERKLFTEEIQRQKTFYETFLNNSPIPLAVFDTNHRYLYLNPKSIKNEELRAWMIGKDDFEYCRFRDKDLAVAQRRREYFNQAVRERRAVEMLETQCDPAGNMHYNLRSYSPVFDEHGSLKMMFGYGLDISERVIAQEKVKESEQLLQSITSNIQVGIFRSTADNRLLYVNVGLVSQFGFESVDEVMKTPLQALFENQADLKSLMDEVDQHSQAINQEFSFCRRDGSRFWGMVSVTKIKDKDGLAFYDAVIRDITELKWSEELLKHKNAELEKTNAELDRFVYSASHELRAPLTSVLGLISIAKLEQPDGEQVSYLNMMEQSVNRLDRFIQEIIHYSRNSRLEIQSEAIDFGALIGETLEDLAYLPEVSTIEKIINVESPVAFWGDKGRLRVVINNLISNAIRYHRLMQERPFIGIDVRVTPQKVMIQVQDNGQGICPQHLNKIFEMFYRATDDAKGSGLGLYIVKETLIKLSGTVSVTSEYKRGTTFTLEIPNLAFT